MANREAAAMVRKDPAPALTGNITLDKGNHLPLYVQVREQLRGRIVMGALPAGTRLPPVRQLAATWEVNLNTVLKAMQELQSEGYIQMKQGRGAFVLPQPDLLPSREQRAAFEQLVGHFVTQAFQMGISQQDMIAAVLSRSSAEPEAPPSVRGIFVECNEPTAKRYASDLERHLDVSFTPVLLEDLEAEFDKYRSLFTSADLVVTTVLHRPEVEAVLVEQMERPRNLYALGIGQMLDLAVRLSNIPAHTPIGLICMSPEDVRVMERSIRQNLPRASRPLVKAPMTDQDAVERVLAKVQVLVLTTVVRERLGDRIPPHLTLVEYRNQLEETAVEMLRQVVDNLRLSKEG
jgi:DNA-binding transcriptional regulator YhcF (GntR family)